MSEPLVRVENVSKKFARSLRRSLWYGLQDIGSELLGRHDARQSGELRPDEFWAVQDVSFELRRGDCLALIGRNGAGKSTLLKMLNGLIKPDTGRIEMRGRVGALIELGTGFNPVLTGRENVYVNGSILGLSKAEIDRRFDAIVEFSELSEFIDTPVRNYSSGMKVRLGFAVAAQMSPSVLLIDEVLAVGDVGFRIKCYNEIYRIIENAAVIFVSHSMPQVAKICNRGLLMTSGRPTCLDANVPRVIDRYYDQFAFSAMQLSGNGKATLQSVTVGDDGLRGFTAITNDRLVVQLGYGNQLQIAIGMEVDDSVQRFNVLFSFTDVDQQLVAQCYSDAVLDHFANSGRPMIVRVSLDELSLTHGKYTMSVTIREKREEGSLSAVLLHAVNVVELRVTHANVLAAAPVQYRGRWESEDA